MSDTTLDAGYWEDRYLHNQTGWDIGYPSTALVDYFHTLKQELRILIPGCGNAWEAMYLHQHGFEQVHILDFAPSAIEHFKLRNPDFPAAHCHCEDFFLHTGHYDLIVEQTFFCALTPALRPAYVRKMRELLVPEGILAGLLFNCTFENPGPPFGGRTEDYRLLLENQFLTIQITPCEKSIPPRQGREVFFEASGLKTDK